MTKEVRLIIYTGIQIGCAVYILLTGPLLLQNIPLLFIQFFSFFLVFWALMTKALQAKTVTYFSRGIFLATTGPYAIIRHPVAAGFLLIMSSFVQEWFTLFRMLTFLLLVLITLMKISYEEKILAHEAKNYAEYKKKTPKLIPYAW